MLEVVTKFSILSILESMDLMEGETFSVSDIVKIGGGDVVDK